MKRGGGTRLCIGATASNLRMIGGTSDLRNCCVPFDRRIVMRAGLFGEAYRETDFDEMCCPVELWMNKSDEAAVPRDGSFANIMDRKDDSLVMIVENLGGFKLKE